MSSLMMENRLGREEYLLRKKDKRQEEEVGMRAMITKEHKI